MRQYLLSWQCLLKTHYQYLCIAEIEKARNVCFSVKIDFFYHVYKYFYQTVKYVKKFRFLLNVYKRTHKNTKYYLR